MAKCTYIFKKGKKVGQQCDAKVHLNNLCKTHAKTINTTSFDLLPCSIVSHIFKYINNVKLFHVLEATNKTFKDIIHQDDIYSKCWEQVSKDTPTNLSIKKCLELYCNTGCQHCGKSRIRKVYVEYGVRYCTDCLYDHTISDYKLKKEYEIGSLDILKNARQNTTEMYHRKLGNYTATFYWTADVVELVRTHFNCTLEEYRVRFYESNQKENHAKLVEFCKTREISHQDIIKHTNFTKASMYPITHFDSFRRRALEAMRKIEIVEFFKSFEDYKVYKDDIKQTKYINTLERNSTALIDSDWIAIKKEIDSIRYENHYDRFCRSFNNWRTVQQLEYVIDKYVAKTYFTDQDKQIIAQLLVTHVVKKIADIKCKYCPPTSIRLFSAQGLRDHCHHVHKIKP